MVNLPLELVEVWEVSGLLSLFEVLGWTWMAWSCWGTPVPKETSKALKYQLAIKDFEGGADIKAQERKTINELEGRWEKVHQQQFGVDYG